MKWILGLVLFVPLTAQGAISQATAVQVSTTSYAMDRTVQAIQILSASVLNQIQNGNTFMVNGSTVAYVLTVAQTQDIVNYYQSLKAQLQNQLNSLP